MTLNRLYRICPIGSDYALYECERLIDAENFVILYIGFYKELEIKTLFLRDATEKELKDHEDNDTGY